MSLLGLPAGTQYHSLVLVLLGRQERNPLAPRERAVPGLAGAGRIPLNLCWAMDGGKQCFLGPTITSREGVEDAGPPWEGECFPTSALWAASYLWASPDLLWCLMQGRAYLIYLVLQ